jgi:hypothetical protein
MDYQLDVQCTYVEPEDIKPSFTSMDADHLGMPSWSLCRVFLGFPLLISQPQIFRAHDIHCLWIHASMPDIQPVMV